MTLSERQRAWAESPVRRVQKLASDLSCGADHGACVMQECAFYDPAHDECIHVLQAQAQIGIAESLAQMVQDAAPKAEPAKAQQLRDIMSAAGVIYCGHRVRRVAWAADKSVWHDADTHRVLCQHCKYGTPVLWAPSLDDLMATDYYVVEEAATDAKA